MNYAKAIEALRQYRHKSDHSLGAVEQKRADDWIMAELCIHTCGPLARGYKRCPACRAQTGVTGKSSQ